MKKDDSNQEKSSVARPIGELAETDLAKATSEELRSEILRTHSHIDKDLARLGRKLKPKLGSRRIWIPLVGLIFGAGGYLLLRTRRRRGKPSAQS